MEISHVQTGEREFPRLVSWSGHTDIGKVRKNNEDSFLGLQFDGQEVHRLGKIGEGTLDRGDFAFAVSDGMGGAMAGEFASRSAVDKITRLLPKSYRQTALGIEAGFADVLGELFDQIHRSLLFLGGDEECSGMGATLSLGWFQPGWLVFGHVGDSRIYYLSKKSDGIRQISQDDTHVAWLLQRGELTEHQARNHPRRNILQKALGAGHRYVEPQIGAISCETGDIFLICSDGLTEGLYNERILQLLRNPTTTEAALNPAQRLVRQAVEISGHDNTTAVVIQIGA